MNIKKYADDWAFDLSKNFTREGEIVNEDVINQSIEFILTTLHGERLFNTGFGSDFQLRVFDTIDKDFLSVLLDDTITAIQTWETRITIVPDDAKFQLNTDNQSIVITLPYIINARQIKAEFKKKLTQ